MSLNAWIIDVLRTQIEQVNMWRKAEGLPLLELEESRFKIVSDDDGVLRRDVPNDQ